MFNKDKIWRIQNDNNSYTDEELVELIKNGTLKKDTRITNRELKKWICIKDTIYNIYLNEENEKEN